MKNASFVTLLGLAAIGCAPVASSVPKLSAQTGASGHGIGLKDQGRELRVTSPGTKVFSSDAYYRVEKELGTTYRIIELKSDQVERFLEKRRVALDLAVGVKSVEAIPMIELAASEEKIAANIGKGFRLALERDGEYPEVYWLSYAKEKQTLASWEFVVKNRPTIHVAYKIVE